MFDKKKDLRVMKVKKLFAVCFLLVTLPCFGVDEQNPSLRTATNSFGMSVAVWLEKVGCDMHVFSQRYDSQENPIGPEFWVSEGDLRRNAHASTTIDAESNFIITWISSSVFGFDYKVHFRIYSSSGSCSRIFEIKNIGAPSREPRFPTVAITPLSGRFIICWVDFELPEVIGGKLKNVNLCAQQFLSDGKNICGVYQLTNEQLLENGSGLQGILEDVNVTDEKITIDYNVWNGNRWIPKTLSSFWADTKPNVTLRYQREENPGDVVVLTISPTVASKKYAVYYCDSLKDNCWSLLGEPVIAESNSLTVIDNGGAASSPLRETKSRFYKVSLVP